MEVRGLVAMTLLAAVVTAGCSSAGARRGDRLPAPPSASPSGPDLSDADLWLSFDDESVDYDGAAGVPGRAGRPVRRPGRHRQRRWVERTAGPADRGRAVAFPAQCAGAERLPAGHGRGRAGPGA